MKNEYGITIEFLKGLEFYKFEAEALWGQSNLKGQRVGYYAYLLQQQNAEKDIKKNEAAMNDKYSLTVRPLKLVLGRIDDLEIRSVGHNWSHLDAHLKKINEDENYREIFKKNQGDKYDQLIKELSDRSPYSGQPMDFELALHVKVESIWQWIILRNAFMIKALLQANITSFEQLQSRCASFVYWDAPLNPDVIAFVKFEEEGVTLPE